MLDLGSAAFLILDFVGLLLVLLLHFLELFLVKFKPIVELHESVEQLVERGFFSDAGSRSD